MQSIFRPASRREALGERSGGGRRDGGLKMLCSILALPSAYMTTEEVLKALGRYKEESRESDRQTATKLGVNQMTMTAWLGGRDRPQRCMLARLAGFLRRVGYL